MKKRLFTIISLFVLTANINAANKIAFAAEYSPIGEGVSVIGNIIRTGAKFLAKQMVKSGMSAYKTALSGGKHSGFLKNYLGKSPKEINKAITSYQKATNVHLDKIANPNKYVSDWNALRLGHQQSLIRGWQNEITNLG
ncbi:MAG: hypothetical protein LBK94_10010 [Prevotellaceae bacterium]|jgi:hypothetical protein|nr:hypothetical protein [Prevotellaceae bacterium]